MQPTHNSARHRWPSGRGALHALALLAAIGLGAQAIATPVTPSSDDTVLERLSTQGPDRATNRQLRQRWAAHPNNAALAVPLAKQYLAQAHREADPRWAGRALAALQHWSSPAVPVPQTPTEVLLVRADIWQYLHDFEPAIALLQQVVAREPQSAQAWLMLATLQRGQGRYAESDAACQGLAASGQALYAQACRAENQGLRGDFDAARRQFKRLQTPPQRDPATNAWLSTSLAELEVRAGQSAAADTAYRQSLAWQLDEYTAVSYADFLISQRRWADALAVLAQVKSASDAVLLRIAIARQTPRSDEARQLRERRRQTLLRPGNERAHAREAALLALAVDHHPAEALKLAQLNLTLQREPVDVLLLAQAAHAAGNAEALAQAKTLANQLGLKDARLDALP